MGKNTARLIKLVVILIILSGIILIKNKLTELTTQNRPEPFKTIKKEEIVQINIQNDNKETRLYKRDNHWLLEKDGQKFAADEDRINKIIDAFTALEKGEAVSSNKSKQEVLGIGKQGITLKTKNKLYVVYIGNNYTTDKNYLKVDDEGDIFTASGFSDLLNLNDFRDLSVHFIGNEEKVSQVQISFDYKNIVLDKKNNDWYSGEKKLIRERVDFFLNDLKTLKSTDLFIKDPMEGSYYPESLTIKIKENSNEKTAIFFQKDESNFYLKTSNSNLIFQVPDVYVSSFKKEEKDFVE